MRYKLDWWLERLTDGAWAPDKNPVPRPWEPALSELGPGARVCEDSVSLHLYNLATLRLDPPDASGSPENGVDPRDGWISLSAILSADWSSLPFSEQLFSGPPVAVLEWFRRLSVLTPVTHYRYAFRMEPLFVVDENELLGQLMYRQKDQPREATAPSVRRGRGH